jgi:hypothetical protein
MHAIHKSVELTVGFCLLPQIRERPFSAVRCLLRRAFQCLLCREQTLRFN